MEKIHKKKLCDNWGSSIFFIANLLNFVLATAVFTIPFPMHEVGIILGTIILTIICFISIIACTFIIEALALKNSILKQENIIFNEILPENERESITTIDKEEKDKKEKEEDINEEKKGDEIKEETEIEGEKRIKEDENKDKEKNKEEKDNEEEINEENKEEKEEKRDNGIVEENSISDNNKDNLEKNNKNNIISNEKKENEEVLIVGVDDDEDFVERRNSLYISQRFEISNLSNALPKVGYYFSVLTIICYLYIGITSNGIIAGNNLKDIIGKSFNIDMPDYSYYIILISFFIITIIIALNNIKHLKKFSMFIIIMRFLIIFLIMGCCFYSMAEYGIADIKDVPKFDLSNITVMIGNSLFVFMSHHSIPGMVENFTPQKRLVKLLIIGYIFSLFFIVLYSYVGIFAFSNPKYSCDKNHEFPIAIQSTFSSNFLGLPVIGYTLFLFN